MYGRYINICCDANPYVVLEAPCSRMGIVDDDRCLCCGWYYFHLLFWPSTLFEEWQMMNGVGVDEGGVLEDATMVA